MVSPLERIALVMMGEFIRKSACGIVPATSSVGVEGSNPKILSKLLSSEFRDPRPREDERGNLSGRNSRTRTMVL